MTYIFIAEHCADLPIRAVCRAMKVTPSAYYAWRHCPVTDKTYADAVLTNRSRFTAEGPDRLWVMDMTEHPTRTGKVYLAVVLDAWSRRIVGWSIADHMRADVVVDAITMATWRRRPPAGQTIAHSDHGSQ